MVLSCETAENERRIHSQERLDLFKGGSRKMLDTSILKDMRERRTLVEVGVQRVTED